MLVDATSCDLEGMINYTNIQRFAKELTENIGMIAFGDPQIHFFGEGDKEGYTLIQLIETSNICAHFANSTRRIFLDVFSCADFKPEIVIETLQKYFDSGHMQTKFEIIERGLDKD